MHSILPFYPCLTLKCWFSSRCPIVQSSLVSLFHSHTHTQTHSHTGAVDHGWWSACASVRRGCIEVHAVLQSKQHVLRFRLCQYVTISATLTFSISQPADVQHTFKRLVSLSKLELISCLILLLQLMAHSRASTMHIRVLDKLQIQKRQTTTCSSTALVCYMVAIV